MRESPAGGYYTRINAMIAAVVMAVVVSGCTVLPSITVGIDSISSGKPVAPSSYILKSAVDGVDESDLHFIEYSRHIHDALAGRGMVRADTDDQATVEIEVNYGSSRQQRAVTRPAFHDNFFHTRRVCKRRDEQGRCVRWVRRHHHGLWDPWHSQSVRVITSYRVFVALEARATNSTDEKPALWATRARANVATPDVRATLPLLLIAARDHIGTDTGREISVVLKADDPALKQHSTATE